MQQEREEVCAALQYAASFRCLVEQWKDCEELRPKPKEKVVFLKKEEREDLHADGGTGRKYMKMRMKMCRTKIIVEKFGNWRRHFGWP